MITSERGLQLIRSFESFRSRPYLCPAGIPTIGYGNTWYLDGTSVKLSDLPITKQQAETLFKNIIKTFEATVNRLVLVSLSQNQFDALVCFVYTIGAKRFASSTLLSLLNRSQFDRASYEFDKWVISNGNRLPGLIVRRRAEKELFNAE